MAAGSRSGTRFGHYWLRSLLGRGGMGEVYEAYDTSKDRTVALKLLDVELARDPTYQQRFRRESHAAARLQEPHVIPIHDWGEIDGVLYIDMRLVPGEDLRSRLREHGPLDPTHAVAILDQIASALEAAHADGLVHRDVKPDNILLTTSDFAYLVDFGIAHSTTDLTLTATGSAIGSYAYMAPERFEDVPVDHRADVYSLACVLHECLTGSVPFPATSISSVVRAHLAAPPPRPSTIRPGVPAAFDEVIAIGMAKNPDDRYRTAGDFAAATRAALTGSERMAATRIANRPDPPITERSDPTRVDHPDRPPIYPSTTLPAGPVRPPGPAPPPGYHPVPVPPRRSTVLPVMVTLLVVAILALGGVVGWLVLDKNRNSNDTSATAPSSRERSTSETGPAPTSPLPTTPPPTTVVTVAPPPPLVGSVSGADGQGFRTPAAARCKSTNPAVFIGRTTQSLVVVCQTGVGRYYYQGVRISDGAGISLDDPTPNGSGFVVTNPSDGTRYQISPAALTIVDNNGHILATEPMLESTHR